MKEGGRALEEVQPYFFLMLPIRNGRIKEGATRTFQKFRKKEEVFIASRSERGEG